MADESPSRVAGFGLTPSDRPHIEGYGVVQAAAQAEVGGVIVMVRFIAVALVRLKRC